MIIKFMYYKGKINRNIKKQNTVDNSKLIEIIIMQNLQYLTHKYIIKYIIFRFQKIKICSLPRNDLVI